MKIVYDFKVQNGITVGFFSNYFFFLQAYIHCKLHRQILYYDDTHWLFTANLGLADYFVLDETKIQFHLITESDVQNPEITIMRHNKEFGALYPLYLYRDAIKDLFVLKPAIIEKTNRVRQFLPNTYNAIFARLGDKLIENKEIGKILGVDMYAEKLLQICNDSNNRNIFVHSDDHNFVLDFMNEMNVKSSIVFNISFITGDAEKGGSFNQIVQNMTKSEIYDHTEKMLVAIETMKYADKIVLDYQSNVSRFMTLYYDKDRICNLFDDAIDERIIQKIPPAFGFVLNGYYNVPGVFLQNV